MTGALQNGRKSLVQRFAGLLLAGLCLLGVGVRAGPTPGIEAWIDDAGSATPAQVAARRTGFEPFNGTAALPGGRGRIWLRWTQPADEAQPLYLWLAAQRQGKVELFDAEGAAPVLLGASGVSLPQSQWMLRGRAPVLVLRPSATPRTVLFSADGPSRAKLVFEAVPESRYLREQRAGYLLFGAYFGLALLALVLVVSLAVIERDAVATIYAGATAALIVAQAALLGFGHEYLWPESPHWNAAAGHLLTALVVLLWLLGAAMLTRGQPRGLWLRLMLPLAIVYVAASLPGWLVLPPEQAQAFSLGAAAAGLIMVAATLLAGWRNGNPHALMFLLAFSPMVLGAAWPLMREFGLIATPAVHARYGVQIGSLVEIVLTVLALQSRARHLRDRATHMIASSQQDPLTGLISQAVARQRLERLLLRARRFQHMSGLMMVELSNLDDIHRQHGRAEAEHALLVAAARLHAMAGEFNTAARWEGHRFALLLEGPCTRDELATFATRVVARGLVDSPYLPPGVQLKLRVAIHSLDAQVGDAAVAVRAASNTLDQLEREQARAIRWCDTAEAPPPAMPIAVVQA